MTASLFPFKSKRIQHDPTRFNQCHHTYPFTNLVKVQSDSNTIVKKLISRYRNQATSQGQVLSHSENRNILVKAVHSNFFLILETIFILHSFCKKLCQCKTANHERGKWKNYITTKLLHYYQTVTSKYLNFSKAFVFDKSTPQCD